MLLPMYRIAKFTCMHANIVHYGSTAFPGAYVCMLTLFVEAA